MQNPNLGAAEFTFTGDRTRIVYFPETPGPVIPGEEGGKLEYQGIEGNFTLFGQNIGLQESPLGTLLTVILKLKDDTGGLTLTVLVPRVFADSEGLLTFGTIAIKATSRGFVIEAGVELTYTVLPLVGVASQIIPL